MRILLIAPYNNIHGPLPKHTPILINALEKEGAIITYIPWGRHTDNETIIKKLSSRFIDAIQINRQIENKSFDLIVLKTGHNFSTLIRDIFLLALIHNSARKISIQFHGSQSNKLIEKGHFLFKLLSKKLLAYADSVIVLSSEEKKEWCQFNSKSVCYITANPYIPPKISLLQQNRKENEILFVGRLVKEKGILELLDAFKLISQTQDCRLVIAGEGPLHKFINNKIDKYNINSKVKLFGYVNERELYELYQTSTMLVLPSYLEGFPTVITEAMYMGLPIITTLIRGIRDHLKENENALFVQPKDINTLSDSIIRLLGDKKLREKMSKNNKELVKNFSPEKIGKNYFEILKDTVAF